ncbi:hypothetical protein [Desertivirga xinjiangensis]|uniref:hypothetical protein n=1 Tax=Desertivirga xinjiangensis TaxID=539206 RepID=UPI00210C71EA|nr:hypothetical protein [Pedobacter xinjiangensis]
MRVLFDTRPNANEQSELIAKPLYKLAHHTRASTAYGKAPHKPVLLISLIDLIEKGLVTGNRIQVDTDLVAAFQKTGNYW